jgi:vacuolar-type H+-ATPase subunit H
VRYYGRCQRAREGPPIDIIFLVERLEGLIGSGKKLPLTNNVVVDQEAALGLIDQLRATVPEEVRQAKRINQDREHILEQAGAEAERIVANAQEQAAFLIDDRGLTLAAQEESQRIIAEAEVQADEIRRGADDYAVSVLADLEQDLIRTLQSVRKGIDVLEARQAELGGALPAAEEDDGAEPAGAEYEDDEAPSYR